MSKKTNLSRREFLKNAAIGAAAVAGAGVLGATPVLAQTPSPSTGLPDKWDLTADVVVIGSGGAGLPAALAAQAKGASVIIVEMNYDVGGHAIVSGGTTDLGGGTPAQVKWNVKDSPDLVFQDLTLNVASQSGLFQDRAMTRVYADNNVAAFNFLVANGMQFTNFVDGSTTPVDTSHWTPASKTPRSNVPMWKGKTGNPAGWDNPGAMNGVGYIRPLEISARNKGIQFLLNYQMLTLYREQPYAGRVVGVSAKYTGGVILPGTTTPLQPYCTQPDSLVPNKGNINMTQTTVNIKANKGVIIATGGATSNVARRKRCDPRMTDVYQVSGEPYSYQTGDGENAAQKIGAALYATGNETGETGAEITKAGSIGCQYNYTNLHWPSTSPIFPLARATGLTVANYQDLIEVNMAGVRFVDETAAGYVWIDAAMAINAASKAPDWSGGPVWAIFDSNAVTREKWVVGSPMTDPLYFYQANDIPTLIQQINTHKYQVTPMDAKVLQDTITKYNGYVDAGKDTDFNKPKPLYKIDTPPYYAATANPNLHDWLTGLHIDGGAHVIDLDEKVIPGLFCVGESAGGMVMHGLAKCAVFGMFAGYNAALGT